MYLYFVIIFFIYLISKPLYLYTGITAVKMLPGVLCILGILRFAFFEKGKMHLGRVVNKIDIAFYGIMLILYFISMVRLLMVETLISMVNEFTQIFGMFFLVYAFINYAFRGETDFNKIANKVIVALISAPAFLIIINVLLYFIGFHDPPSIDADIGAEEEGGLTVMLSMLGFNVRRSSLVFMIHTNNAAVMVGSIALTLFLGLRSLDLSRWQRLYFAVALGASLIALLLFDSRGAMGSAFLVAIGALFLNLIRSFRIFHLSLWVLPVLPFFLMAILAMVGESEIGQSISRKDGDNNIASGNGRSYIWEHCINEVLDPKIAHFMGYGQVGHIASGLDKKWAWKFPGWVTHSFFFQSFLDLGYLGILSIILALQICAKSAIFLYKRGIKTVWLFVPFPTYYLLSGMFECTFGVYNHAYTSIALTFMLFPILIKNAYLNHQIMQYSENAKLTQKELYHRK